jgi:hypothetical protein
MTIPKNSSGCSNATVCSSVSDRLTPNWIAGRIAKATGQVFDDFGESIKFGKYRGKPIGDLLVAVEAAEPHHIGGRREKDYLVWAVNKNVIAFRSKEMWERYIAAVSKQFLVESCGDYSDDPMEGYMGIGDFC